MPESPNQTVISPGSGSITDAAGNVFTIDAAGNILENGKAITGGENTKAAEYYNHVSYFQDARTGAWFTWNGSIFVSATAPPIPTVPGGTYLSVALAASSGTPGVVSGIIPRIGLCLVSLQGDQTAAPVSLIFTYTGTTQSATAGNGVAAKLSGTTGALTLTITPTSATTQNYSVTIYGQQT